MTALVNSESAVDRSLTLLLRDRSRKNKMATLNELTSVLAAILSDTSDDSDTNFIYVLSTIECQQRNNDEITLAAVSAKHEKKSQFVYKQRHESRE